MKIIKEKVDLDSFVGQEQVKKYVKIMVEDALCNKKLLPHLLLIGPPGVGKTTFVKALYLTLKKNINNLELIVSPTGRGVFAENSIKNQLARAGNRETIFFFDEAHYLKPQLQETLYEVMDNRKITVTKGGTKFVVELPPITVIAATTEPGKLLSPFISRMNVIHFDNYSQEEIQGIIKLHKIKKGRITQDAICLLSEMCKMNPRIASKNLKRTVSWANNKGISVINEETLINAMKDWGVHKHGLESLDINYIQCLLQTNEPVGLDAISNMLATDKKYIETTVEPYLIASGYLMKTRSGRMLTPLGVQEFTSMIQKGEM